MEVLPETFLVGDKSGGVLLPFNCLYLILSAQTDCGTVENLSTLSSHEISRNLILFLYSATRKICLIIFSSNQAAKYISAQINLPVKGIPRY